MVIEEMRENSVMPFKKEAIKNGLTCPFCGFEGIESDGVAQHHAELCFLDVTCLKCEKQWTERYKLMDVFEEDYEG